MTRVKLIAGMSSLLFGLSTTAALADSPKQQCVDAFEGGQRSQLAGDLQRAIEQYETCAMSLCPPAARRECSRLLDLAQAAMPAIQFELKFDDDLRRRRVTLSIDEGERRAYDGEVLRMNPGKHRFVFECEGCATVTRQIAFTEQDSERKDIAFSSACEDADEASEAGLSGDTGQLASCSSGGRSLAVTRGSSKRRPVSSELARAPLSPSDESATVSARVRDTVILGSAATLTTAGALGFISFGLGARRSERALSECTPYCSGSRIAEVKLNYLLANVSLGTGIFGLGGAAIWWFGLRRPSQPASSDASARGQWSVELGAINTVTRTF